MLAGAVAGFALVIANEDWFTTLIPESMAGSRGPGSSAADLRNTELFAPWPGFTQSFVVFANFLFQHNTMVGLLTFGFGVLAGVPTFLLLVYQGLMFGAFLALHYNRGLLVDCLGWVAIHGVTEIGALILCGAGGLLIAEKILFPDQYSRLDSLAIQGRRAGSLAAGAVMMLLIAGLIEGGFRQLINVTYGRFAFAAMTVVLWGAYFRLSADGGHDGAES
jgi:uncharacterized membrane protein SpoIIM required for sporulation